MGSPMGKGPSKPGTHPTPIYPSLGKAAKQAGQPPTSGQIIPAAGQIIPTRLLESFFLVLPKADVRLFQLERTIFWVNVAGGEDDIAVVDVGDGQTLVIVDHSFFALDRVGATNDVQLVGAASLLGRIGFELLVNGQNPYQASCEAAPNLLEPLIGWRATQHGIMQMSGASGVVGFALYAKGQARVQARYRNVFIAAGAGQRADLQQIAVYIGVVLQGFYIPTLSLEKVLAGK